MRAVIDNNQEPQERTDKQDKLVQDQDRLKVEVKLRLKAGLKEMLRTEGWEYLDNIFFPEYLERVNNDIYATSDMNVVSKAQGKMAFYLDLKEDIKSALLFKEEKKDVVE